MVRLKPSDDSIDEQHKRFVVPAVYVAAAPFVSGVERFPRSVPSP